jgi:hypothetical protein
MLQRPLNAIRRLGGATVHARLRVADLSPRVDANLLATDVVRYRLLYGA